MNKKKFLIYGTGAVGAYYGGMLVKSGEDVTFVARGKNFEALKSNGLTIQSKAWTETFPVKAIDSNNSTLTSDDKFDFIIICTKSMQTLDAIDFIKPFVSSETAILSFQNGVDNEEKLINAFGKSKVLGAFVYVASALVNPGVVSMMGNQTITIGEISGEETKRTLYLKSAFEKVGVNCVISKDVLAEMWNKLVWNTAFNSTSVLTKMTLDKMLANKEILSRVRKIMEEVKKAAIANGINIRPDTVDFNIERSYGYSGFKTSMLQDYEKGNPLEIDALIGIVVKKAKEKNIEVPETEKTYNELLKVIKTKA